MKILKLSLGLKNTLDKSKTRPFSPKESKPSVKKRLNNIFSIADEQSNGYLWVNPLKPNKNELFKSK